MEDVVMQQMEDFAGKTLKFYKSDFDLDKLKYSSLMEKTPMIWTVRETEMFM